MLLPFTGETRPFKRGRQGCPDTHGRALQTMPDKPLQPLSNLVQARCLEDLRRDNIGVHVRSGATVLEITTLLGLGLPGDAYGRPAIGYAIAELVDRCSLVCTSEAPLVSFAVGRDVLGMLCPELLDRGDDLPVAIGLAHRLCGVVGVAASTIPITRDRLGVEGDVHLLGLANADHQVAGHPEMVAAVDTHTRPDLVLPLARHDLRIRAGDLNARVEASLVVCFHD